MASERILLTGKIVAGGEIMWRIAPQVVSDYPAEVLPPLQDFIDYAAELQELQDGMDDEAYWRSGQW